MGQQDLKIHELVAKIERGEIRLPEMQRQYVWKKTRVRDLLDSLYRGYPSGTILTWDTDETVETRETPIAQKSDSRRFQLLLDGQQRLISMSAVLRGEPILVGGQERPINILFNLEHPEVLEFVTEVQEHDDPESDRDEETSEATDDDLLKRFNKMAFVIESRNISRLPHWVSVTEVFRSQGESKFLAAAGIKSLDDPKCDKYTERLTRLRAIKNYEYRVHVLDNSMSYEEVTEIFVRVNSLGAKLRSSDLALAQITAKWKNSLRVFQEHEEKCKASGFDLGLGIHIRNLVAFASGQAKFKVVSSLTQSRLEEAWKFSIAGMDFALEYLRENLGIEDSDLLTSPFLAIALAFYAHTKKYKISAMDGGKLRRWALVANAKGRYSRGSSETLLDQDLSAIREGTGIDRLLHLLETQVGRLDVEESELEGKVSTSAYFKTMLIVFRKDGAFDWKSGLAASKRKLQKHHIFPKKVLKGKWVTRTINDMCNMAFISGLTNQKIGGRAPSEYLPEIVREQGEEALLVQAIPIDRCLWEIEAYEEFLKERRKLVAARLNSYLQSK